MAYTFAEQMRSPNFNRTAQLQQQAEARKQAYIQEQMRIQANQPASFEEENPPVTFGNPELQRIYDKYHAQQVPNETIISAINRGYQDNYSGKTISGKYPSGYREIYKEVRMNPELNTAVGIRVEQQKEQIKQATTLQYDNPELQKIYDEFHKKGVSNQTISEAISKGYQDNYTGDTLSGKYEAGFKEVYLEVRKNQTINATAKTDIDKFLLEQQKIEQQQRDIDTHNLAKAGTTTGYVLPISDKRGADGQFMPLLTSAEKPPEFPLLSIFSTKNPIVKGWVNIYKYADAKIQEGVYYLNPSSVISPLTIVKPSTKPSADTGKVEPSINLTELIGTTQEKLLLSEESAYKQNVQSTGIEKKVSPKYQELYNERFLQAYSDKIQKGQITQEEAEKAFALTKEAQDIQSGYMKAIEEERKNLPWAEKFVYGVPSTLRRTGAFLLGAIKTPKQTVKTGAIVYAGYHVITALPASVNLAITGTQFGYGAYKLVSPTSSPEEVGESAFTTAISGAILGRYAYKYFRMPKVSTEAVESAKLTKADSEMITRQRSMGGKGIVDENGDLLREEKYSVSQNKQYSIAGRKTIVTSQGRYLLNKYLGTDIKPLYSGNPYTPESRGEFSIITGKYEGGNYERALDRLIEYGQTESQARSTLRLIHPRFITTDYSGVTTIAQGGRIKGAILQIEGKRLVTQPSLPTESGIKTLGKQTYYETISGQGVQIEGAEGKAFTRVTYEIEKSLVSPKGALYNKLSQAGKTSVQSVVFSEITDKGTGVEQFFTKEKLGGLPVASKGVPYTLHDVKSLIKQTLPPQPVRFSQGGLKTYEGIPYFEEYDSSVRVTKTIETEQKPYVKIENYGKKELKILIKDLEQVYGKSGRVVLAKPIPAPKATLPSGAGSATETVTQFSTLKADTAPPFTIEQTESRLFDIPTTNTKSITQLMNLISTQQKSMLVSKLNVNQMIASMTMPQQKSVPRQVPMVKQITSQVQKAIPVEVAIQKVINVQEPVQPVIPISPDFPIPRTEIPATPNIPPFAFPMFDLPKEKKGGKRGRKKRKHEVIAIMPDFSARVLELEVPQVKITDVHKVLSKLRTGLEIRTGAGLRQ